MTAQLYINDKDAYTNWKAVMDDGCFEELLKPAAPKPFVENEFRSIAGKQVLPKNPQPQAREIKLNISLKCDNLSTYLTNYKAFFAELAAGLTVDEVPTGKVKFYVPALAITFKLIYTNSDIRMSNINKGFVSFQIYFTEPDPTDRT